MITGIWGKKIGMTQVFSEKNQVIPVTLIDVSNWLVTQVKNKEQDGYSAVQLGCLRQEFAPEQFAPEWLSKPKKYFSVLREVTLNDDTHSLVAGQAADVGAILAQGDSVDVSGTTIGRGFQGVVKRYNFGGGRASHGDKLGRSPGSLSFMRKQGRVIKGKKMPGHMGVESCVVQNLQVVKVEPAAHVVFVKGSVPGKCGSLVFVRKRG